MKSEQFAIDGHPLAESAMQRWEALKSARAHHETDWEDIARLIRPQRGGFGQTDFTKRSYEKPLSSAPIVAQNNFAAGLYGTLTNPANRWFELDLSDPDRGQSQAVREWLDTVTDRILASFQPSVSPFYSASVQLFSDIASFGNAAQYDEVNTAERKIMDVTLSLAEVCYDIDGYGRVCEVVRKFLMTPRAAVGMFRQVPQKIHDLAEKGSQDKLTFYHHVFKNMDYQKGMLGPKGKRWRSVYASEEGKSLLRDSGYAEMPFHAPRWEVESGAIYGTGAGFVALPSARLVQRMKDANLRAGQRAADPTLLAPNRSAWKLSGVVRPGAVLYDGLDYAGRPNLQPLNTNSDTRLTLEMQEREIEDIRDAFHWSLMNMAGRTGMTATEVIERNEEKLRLMAPHMGRVQEEFLAPKIQRRFQMLYRAGQLPPPPEDVGGEELQVVYTSAAAQAQKSAEGAAVMRLVQNLGPLAELDPRYADRLSPDDITEVLHEAGGVPARILRSREEANQLAEKRAQQQQQAQQMEMLAQGGQLAQQLGVDAQQLQEMTNAAG